MLKEAVIISNPNAGLGWHEARLKRCTEILRSGGLDVEVWLAGHSQHATKLASLAGLRLVIAAGGNGTVNGVINGLKRDATLGILPFGTMNVLVRELGLPLKVEAACKHILTGTESRIDVGIATDHKGTERRFICMAGLGFDARVLKEVDAHDMSKGRSYLRRRLKLLSVPLMSCKVYLKADLPTLHIVHGDVTYKTQFAIVANTRHYGGGFQAAEGASVTTGKFEVVLVDRVSRVLRPDILARILVKRPINRFMSSFTAEELRAESPGAYVPVHLDGEVWGRLPMSFRIDPAALKVVS
jgi:diacylglycerol kinase (ATP)